MLHKYDENIYLKAFGVFLFNCSLTKYSWKIETQIEEKYLLNTAITILIKILEELNAKLKDS